MRKLRLLEVEFLSPNAQMVRGRSEFERQFVDLENLCLQSHSATSLPLLWGTGVRVSWAWRVAGIQVTMVAVNSTVIILRLSPH